jgi:myo-inositol catabolism protein IolC
MADVWKIEGLSRREDCRNVAAVARRDGRDEAGCIVLGRGSNEQKVAEWLRTGAGVLGFTGFAVGRTSFWGAVGRMARRQDISRGGGRDYRRQISRMGESVRRL